MCTYIICINEVECKHTHTYINYMYIIKQCSRATNCIQVMNTVVNSVFGGPDMVCKGNLTISTMYNYVVVMVVMLWLYKYL